MTIDWAAFAPLPALAGGLMIGAAASVLVLVQGRVAGISGILGGLLGRPGRAAGEAGWRIAFLAGLLLAPGGYRLLAPLPSARIEAGFVLLALAGFLVGIGTRYGAGCTSGHGVCGLARLSPRSLAATSMFMVCGFVTVYVARHVIAGGA